MTIEELMRLGLNDKEAHLYLACIEHGPSKAKDISAYTNLNRGTVYDIARTLFRRGLMSTTQKKNVTHFIALSPHRYIYQLDQELSAASEMLPRIEEMLESSHYRPIIRFFEGEEGIKAVYEETLKSKTKQLYCFVSMQEIIEAVGDEFLDYYMKKRIRRHIHIQTLHDPHGEVENISLNELFNTNDDMLREAKIGPTSINVAGNFMIYDDCVALMSTKRENFGTVLKSEEYAHMMRNLFDMVWGLGKPI